MGLKARPDRASTLSADPGGSPAFTADAPSASASLGPVPGAAVLLAHGAGGHKDHPHILDLSALLTGLGLAVVRFDFPYRARGGHAPPDRMPVLVDSVRAVAAAARESLAPSRLYLAGHSMGGRACSMAAADGLPCDGLILFSYPWHPPGRPDKPRADHLPRIPVPTLCLTGTRDAFCERKHLGGVFSMLPEGWTQAWVEEADHGLDVLKRSGRTRADVMAEAGGAVRAWLEGPARGRAG